MKNIFTGYTLIELIVTVSLLAMILTGGTAIFYRSFRSSSISDVQTVVNNGLRSLDEMLEGTLRYGTVIRVTGDSGDKYRADCLESGETGVVGDTLVVNDSLGESATYTFLSDDGTVSSNSGVIISNPEITVINLQFTWYCRSGVNDKMNLLIEATSSAKTGEEATGILSKDINLYNSGIN